MKVLIAAPVRDRAWILPEYLKAIENVSFTESIQYYFIINDCADNSRQILDEFKTKHNNCVIDEINFNAPKDERNSVRISHTFNALSFFRNKIVEYFLSTDCDILFSIDTDIIIKPECLNRLLEVDADIVSAFIYNDYNQKKLGNALIGRDKIVHIDISTREEIFSCSITGACYIIKRSVLEAGCRYGWHSWGEDTPFCFSALDKGFKMKCRQGDLAEHFMGERP